MAIEGASAAGEPRVATVTLRAPLESFGDCWPALRQLWDTVPVGGTATIRYGSTGFPYRLTRADAESLLRLSGFSPVSTRTSGRGFETVASRRPREARPLSCTVVVPCRNEVGNVDGIVERVPEMGSHTEILFVDGASSDGTPDRIEALIAAKPERDIKLVRQAGNTGKGGATFQGFAAAAGDVVMILDADMTVRPEDLPRFYLALAEGVAAFANGTRLIYPMEADAMPGLNAAGNRIFSRYMSWLLGTRISDTLCGTKAVLKEAVPCLLQARPEFGGHDPWGDFDLLMGARWCGLAIIDVPITYVAREAGESKMRPWAHGAALGQTCLAGARKLKLARSRHS